MARRRPCSLLIAVALASASCAGPVDSRSEDTRAMVSRLAELAARQDRDRDPMMSSRRVAAMRPARLPSDPQTRLEFERGFAVELLRAGENDEAIALLQRLLREISGFTGQGVKEVQLDVLEWLTVAHLTAALRDECLTADVVDSCLVPGPGGGGPARRQDHARVAASGFDLLLQSRPDHLPARWLLNLAAMRAGQYPSGLDPRWLVSPAAFGSVASAAAPGTGAAPSALAAPFPRFPEVARRLGISVIGYAGGSAMDDFDGDGHLDLVVSSMGLEDQLRLFLNDRRGAFIERTKEAGLEGITGGLNLNQADYDNDGDRDVLLLRGGWDRLGGQPLSLFRNLGDGRFEDVTEAAGLLRLRATQSAAWGDFNNDGRLDLYLGNESLDRTQPNELFEAQPDGTFREVGRVAGAAVAGYTKGVAWGTSTTTDASTSTSPGWTSPTCSSATRAPTPAGSGGSPMSPRGPVSPSRSRASRPGSGTTTTMAGSTSSSADTVQSPPRLRRRRGRRIPRPPPRGRAASTVSQPEGRDLSGRDHERRARQGDVRHGRQLR